MQVELVNIIRCPECGSRTLLKDVRNRVDDNLVEGCIQCSECDKIFEIKRGILDMLYAPDDNLSQEIRYWDARAIWPEENPLSRNLREKFLLHTYDCLGKILQSHLHEQTSLLLLELGCGTGDTIEFMPLNIKQVTYVGIDLSIERLLIASRRKRANWKINLIRGDANKCLLKRNVDVAVSFAALHHLNLEKALEAISASLRSEGLYILFEPNKLNFLALVNRRFIKNICFCTKIYLGAMNEERLLYSFEVETLAQSFGLTLKEQKGMSMLSSPYAYSVELFSNFTPTLARMLKVLERPVSNVDDFLQKFPFSYTLSTSFLQVYKKR